MRKKESIFTTSRPQSSRSEKEGCRGSNASGKSQLSIKTRRHRDYMDNSIEDVENFADYCPQIPETSIEGF